MNSEQNSRDDFWPQNLHPGHKEQMVELGVFLLLIVPSMVLPFVYTRQGRISFSFVAWAAIFRDFALVSLIWYFLWRNSEGMLKIGWNWHRWKKEALIGAALFIPMTVSIRSLDYLLSSLGFSSPNLPMPWVGLAGHVKEMVLAVLLVVVVAISEETIFRGYILLRLKSVTNIRVINVLVSAAIFAIGHGYEGTAGVITVGYMGLVFAIVYLWRKSLAAPMVMHFLQDFIGIVVFPLLARK